MKTTNYLNTFIEVAEDCPVDEAEIPPVKGNTKSAARIQYEMISEHPYKYSSDDVIFEVYALKKEISETDRNEERKLFFTKGQPCMRTSALTKRYGWGVHSNAEGKIAIYAVGSNKYNQLSNNDKLEIYKAMRSKRG